MALGSRLRRLWEVYGRCSENLCLYDIAFDPKGFSPSTSFCKRKSSITEIAQIIGHSHPSVSQIVKEMTNIGLTTTAKSVSDARVNVVKLWQRSTTYPYNQKSVHRRNPSCGTCWGNAVRLMEGDWGNGVLERKDFYTRVRENVKPVKANRLSWLLTWVYEDFKRLNYEWIEKFKLESTDHQSLNHPSEKILQPGGHILMARYNREIVGTCALKLMMTPTNWLKWR